MVNLCLLSLDSALNSYVRISLFLMVDDVNHLVSLGVLLVFRVS